MKLQASAYLEKSRALLERAPALLEGKFTDEAGRAYLAGFHAAPALIFEREDRVFKSHKGVQGELARLVKSDPRFDIELRAFLGRAYNLKAIADYETGPGSIVSHAQAAEAVALARRFVDAIEQAIGS